MDSEIQKIINKIQGKSQGFTPPTLDKSLFLSKERGIRTFKYDVPREAIYDKLSDGSYIPKFENYKGAIGNEDRLAKEQGFFEKAGYGIGKFVGKTVKNALDATVGTVYGVINGISEGSLSKVWDNDFSNTMDDWNKRMNYNLPNYYTDEEKNMGLLRSMGTANFWFNDVGDGLAFVAGALLPELAIGAATGGTTLGVGLGKASFKAGAKDLLKEGAEKTLFGMAKQATKKVDDAFNYSVGREGIRQMYRTALQNKKLGDIASTTGFLFRTSNFEAGMEARTNFHDAMENFQNDFEAKNGRPPSLKEVSEFSESAKNAANGVYGANLAILAVSNAAMFGKAFDIKLPKLGKNTNNFLNRTIGLGVNKLDDGTLALAGANKLQRVAGNTYKVLSKPLIEGVYEEGLQGVAGKTMQNYLNNKYDPSTNEAHGIWANLTDALAEQYGTQEGWKEMGIGMIIGMLGPVIQGQSPSGFGKDSRKARQNQIGAEIEEANKGIETLRNLDRSSSARNFRNVMESKVDKFESTSAENTLTNVAFVQSQENIKTNSDIQKDYNTVIDNMQLDSKQMSELEANGIDFETYKDSLKQEFKQDLDNYNFAKKAVEAVGLDKVKDINPGNRATVKDAMIMNLVLGKDSLSSAKNIAKQLDALIKPVTYSQEGEVSLPGGIFDHLQFYNSLTKDQKQAASDLRQKQAELKKLQDKNVMYQQELAGLQTRRTRKLKDTTLEKNINNVSEKAVLTVNQITKVQSELENLQEALNSDFTATQFDLDGTITSEPTNITSALEEIDKLDKYTEALRKVGKNYEADSIEYLIDQFKFHSDSHREMMNAHRRMLDTNFFSSKQGKGFLKSLTGKPYVMSDDFKQLIKDNDAKIDASLGLMNIRGYEKVEEVIEEALEKNPNLSDREKYKIESMLRIQLNMDAIKERVDNITTINTEYSAQEDKDTTSPLAGDTIRLKQSLDIQNRNLDNVDELDKVIKELTEQLDEVRNYYKKDKIKELESQLSDLKSQQESTENPEETQQKEIQDLETQIEELKNNVKIVNSEEVKRFTELSLKRDNDILSPQEQQELEKLESEINDWMLITGIVAEELRLSDLIRQKAILENTVVTPLETVAEVTPSEVIEEINLSDNTGRTNYSYAQSPDAVTARTKGDDVIVSGISAEDLVELAGIPFSFEISKDNKNNIVIPRKEIDKINQAGGVSILATNKNLTTTYSVVIVHHPDKSERLKSIHSEDFFEDMNTNAIYELEAGSEISYEVDARDPWNKKLYKDYQSKARNKKITPEQLEEEKEKLRVGVVIRVRANGNFVATLKGKNPTGNKNIDAFKFEAFRDEIVDKALEQGVFLRAASAIIETDDTVVQQVLMGHPSFNFKKEDDGTVSIEYKKLSETDINKVSDIGYVEGGKMFTKSNVKGVNTTFIEKFIKDSQETKIPFIVLEVFGKRIAYPVKVAPREKTDNTEITAVFNNPNLTVTDKVVKLNQMLAERGIDIKIPGNAFTSVGKTNLNKDFLDQKLAQLDSIDYFRPLKEWISKEDNMKNILREQVLVNIDLANPFHSPKIKIDFSKAFENITVDQEKLTSASATKKTKSKGTQKVVSSVMAQLTGKC